MNEAAITMGKGATATLLESMRVVQNALKRPSGIPHEQLILRLQEWQQMVTELARGSAEGAEVATLYEIIAVLNSSLDLTETLGLVMDSLIHLTGAERGCLMLLNEEDKLEIRAAQNFDQESIDASDLEVSQTVVREAVDGGKPVLTTNAQRDPRFSGQESVVGYNLRSIVCVPLHVRDWVIGALYLDNRIREDVFSEADLPLLTAFASQAATAIENARLYTMTDQALTARVEELTTLQHIDQELNASLDLGRVLDLALSWALQATRADVGTLCILDSDGKVVAVAHAGDRDIVEPGPDVVQRVMSSRDPILVEAAQMLVPIHYEDRVVGLLDLRRNNDAPFHSDRIQFAGQFAGHAAMAIENARLYEQVQQANRAKTEFISFVAHELRTPMTSIRGYAEMLLKGMFGELPPQQKQFIQVIGNNVKRMQIQVSDLQDVSRIEAGHLRLEMHPTSLKEALAEALQSTQGQVEARSQQLTLAIPDDLPLIHADPTRLTQVLINLFSNAYKYTPEGGSIDVRAWSQDEYVSCAVSDTGIGMSPEDLEKLFTKFFRSEDPAVRDMPGTGLGLCITKSLVELQGGEMKVESQLGEGTTFT
ncbi:MAG: GAF domain-containing protein, partial [Chloroflexota bacterium]|nr:GAF domain-containing protein [Chloroflexota bacterium]